jgi:hypothetical protein
MKSKKKERTELNKIKKELFSFFNQALPHIIASFIVLIIFFVVVDTYEYLTTEYWWLQNSINYKHTTIFLFILIALLALFDWGKIVKKLNWTKFLIPFLFLLSILGHRKYSLYYSELQRYPKVLKISKNWGLAGSWVKIEGRNFGETHKAGKVFIGEEEMLIKKWTSKEIVFEIPTRNIKGEYLLKIENKYQKKQKEEIRFRIK